MQKSKQISFGIFSILIFLMSDLGFCTLDAVQAYPKEKNKSLETVS